VFLFVPATAGVGIWSFLDPLALYHRVSTVVLFPLATWAVKTGLDLVGRLAPVAEPAATLADRFTTQVIPEGQNLFLGVWPLALLITGILLLELAAPRFWCRFVCPAGAWLGLLARRALFRRRVDPTCVRCAGCRRDCPMGAIPAAAPETTLSEACTLCMGCLGSCPDAVVPTTFSFGQGLRAPGTGLSRREFLGTVVGSVAAVGTNRLSLADRREVDRLLRPPGAVVEPLFLDRCVRCLSCVRICRTNGGCLQPGRIHQDLLELWAPEAVMRVGYCEYECNLCGRVCPTGVIRPLALEEKKKTVMGMAYFDRNLCIPYARHEDCMVCEEHCPVPDKAIQFESLEVTLPDGTKKPVKTPRVVRNLCIGCGICETKCPLPGAPGVFVANECAQRPDPPS
jgi:ferredoxin